MHNEDAEKAVLGCILIDDTKFKKVRDNLDFQYGYKTLRCKVLIQKSIKRVLIARNDKKKER